MKSFSVGDLVHHKILHDKQIFILLKKNPFGPAYNKNEWLAKKLVTDNMQTQDWIILENNMVKITD